MSALCRGKALPYPEEIVLPVKMRDGENVGTGELAVKNPMKLVVPRAASRTFAYVQHDIATEGPERVAGPISAPVRPDA